MKDTGGTGDARKARLIEAVVGAILGEAGAREVIQREARHELEESLIGPARRFRESNNRVPFQFGPETGRYVARALVHPGVTQGLILGLLEVILTEREAQPASTPDPDRADPADRPTGWDYAALAAERNSLADRLSKANREQSKLLRERDELQEKIARLDADLIEAHGRAADHEEHLLAYELRAKEGQA